MLENDLDKTRERILEAAGELFAERGFESTTVRDICQAAGANVAAVNYYFRDKERLYVEAVVRAHRWRLDQATASRLAREHAATARSSPISSSRFSAASLGGPDDTWRTRLVMREIMQPSAACAEIAQSNIRPQFEILQGILRELLPNASDEELHLTAFSIVGQCLFYHVAGSDHPQPGDRRRVRNLRRRQVGRRM